MLPRLRALLAPLTTVLLGAGAAHAQIAPTPAAPAAPAPVAAQPALERALLWRVESPGATAAPSYVFGTIHLIDAKDFALSDSVMAAINRVDAVYFEIDPAEMTDLGVQMSLLTKAMMRGDTTLRDLLTAEEYARVDAHFREIGLPMMLLDRVKPMFLSALVGTDLADMGSLFGTGDDGDGDSEAEGGMKSYELELDGIARATDKRVHGLETSAFQLSLFDSIPYRAQAQMLLGAIDAPDDAAAGSLDALTQLYVTGDVDAMYTLTVGEDSGLAAMEELLLLRRNRAWVPAMKSAAAQAPTFFAVGAGHLGGPEGVIRLLRAEGLTVTPMSVR